MIVDTSALIAALAGEEGSDAILQALIRTEGLMPAPALVEYRRVASRAPHLSDDRAEMFVSDLFARRLSVLALTPEHARVAAAANRIYGAGVAVRGTLNLLDLMVYACAKVERRPILCTGLDFTPTDAAIHPASRRS